MIRWYDPATGDAVPSRLAVPLTTRGSHRRSDLSWIERNAAEGKEHDPVAGSVRGGHARGVKRAHPQVASRDPGDQPGNGRAHGRGDVTEVLGARVLGVLGVGSARAVTQFH